MRNFLAFFAGLALMAQSQSTQPIPTQFPPVHAEPIPTQIPPPTLARAPVRGAGLLRRPALQLKRAVLMHKAEPKYTPEARAAGLQGTVSLYVEVDRDGKPSDVQVMEGLGLGLDEAAVNAVERWEYQPRRDAVGDLQDALEVDIPFRLDAPEPWLVGSESYRAIIPKHEPLGEIVRPVPTRYVAPDAAACREAGSVTVRVTVGTNGAPHSVQQVEGAGGALGEAAVKAVEGWQFKPASLNGKKLEALGRIEFACRPPGAAENLAAAESHAYPLSGPVSAPVLRSKVEPDYSELARKAKLQGTSILYVQLSPAGKATEIHVIKRLGMGLDQKAIEAVKRWVFTPGMKGGHPVTVEATIEVNFKLL